MFNRDFETESREWKENFFAWERKDKKVFSYTDPEDFEKYEYWEYEGDPPDRGYFMPKWKESERTHLQMYECTSEGTPISPVMETPEELARWLADNRASSFGPMTATYEEWLNMIVGVGYSIGMVSDGKTWKDGVSALNEMKGGKNGII